MAAATGAAWWQVRGLVLVLAATLWVVLFQQFVPRNLVEVDAPHVVGLNVQVSVYSLAAREEDESEEEEGDTNEDVETPTWTLNSDANEASFEQALADNADNLSSPAWPWASEHVAALLSADDVALASALSRKSLNPDMALRLDLSAETLQTLTVTLRREARRVNPLPNSQTDRRAALVLGHFKTINYNEAPLRLALSEHLNMSVVKQRRLSMATSNGARRFELIQCYARFSSWCLSETDLVALDAQRGRFARVSTLAGLRDVIWAKDAFCSTLRSTGEWMAALAPPCWVLPRDVEALALFNARHANSGQAFIAKPFNEYGGKGIFVADAENGLPRLLSPRSTRRVVLQPFLGSPHLLDGGRKWDLRVYALLTSVTPFARVFVFDGGLVRLAKDAYDGGAARGGKRTQFLTNTSVNRKREKDFSRLTWSLAQLEQALGAYEFKLLMRRVRRAVGMLAVAAEARFALRYRSVAPGFLCEKCFGLIGVDVLVDAHKTPRIIEVNGNPSMQLSDDDESHYDATKLRLQRAAVKLLLEPLPGLLNLTIHTLSNEAPGLSRTDVERLAQDPDAAAYVMSLIRETRMAEGFQLAYPDPAVCSRKERAALWDAFLGDALEARKRRGFYDEGESEDAGGEGPAGIERRRWMHTAASAVACRLPKS